MKQDAVNYTGMAGQDKEDGWGYSKQGRYRNQSIMFENKQNENDPQY